MSQAVRWLIDDAGHNENSRWLLLHSTQMVRGDPTTISSMALTKREVAGVDLRRGSTPCHRSRVQVLTVVSQGQCQSPCFD